MPEIADRLGVSEAVARRVRADFTDDRRLRAALVAEKRTAVLRLRDDGRIDDIVLRRVQAALDAEESRLADPAQGVD